MEERGEEGKERIRPPRQINNNGTVEDLILSQK